MKNKLNTNDYSFRIFYILFLTTIYFLLQILIMNNETWLIITINTFLTAISANAISKYYKRWINLKNKHE